MVRLLNYNEHKVQNKLAELILVNRFGCDAAELSFKSKLARFEKVTATNTRAKANAIHISLNFDTNEHLSFEKLQDIAVAYMEGIGFDNQPYLVYEHFDAGHPHIHIVTTNIRSDGKRIDLHNIGRNQSEKTRKELELKYGLVRAEDHAKEKTEVLRPVVFKAQYSKTDTKRTIAAIVNAVLSSYRYSSFSEYNAILKCFNVCAVRGAEGSAMYDKRGLLYSITDEQGTPVGIPIKASAFFSKPTLKNIDSRFAANAVVKKAGKHRTKQVVEQVLKQPGVCSKEAFTQALQSRHISAVFWESKTGFIYGVTFVNHNDKVVYNGSELGKEFSAKQLLEKLQEQNRVSEARAEHKSAGLTKGTQSISEVPTLDLLNNLMQPENESAELPYELRKKKRKRRKPNQ